MSLSLIQTNSATNACRGPHLECVHTLAVFHVVHEMHGSPSAPVERQAGQDKLAETLACNVWMWRIS